LRAAPSWFELFAWVALGLGFASALVARDSWWQVSLSDTHCGAGCALGDIAGEWIVWAMAVAEYAIWNSPPPIDSSSHWFLMQIGMIVGFATSWPVNRWLLRHGIKEPTPTVSNDERPDELAGLVPS
jgi:Domain of unknown function (DUF4396)